MFCRPCRPWVTLGSSRCLREKCILGSNANILKSMSKSKYLPSTIGNPSQNCTNASIRTKVVMLAENAGMKNKNER